MASGNTHGDANPNVAGGPTGHVPVMLDEVLEALQPTAGEYYIDGTFGAGGYSRAILDRGANLLAIDKDPNAVASSRELLKNYGNRFRFVTGEFGELDAHCKGVEIDGVDGVVLDIGVSSMQIDEAARGFSFQNDGPLDMRMGQTGLSASDVINRSDVKDLTRLIGMLGEERHAGRVSRAIVARRELEPITRTIDLARIVEKTLGRKHSDKIHPATRTFQALRIFVNQELVELAKALFAAERILKTGGRLVVVTFHSLEDRIVKQFFSDRRGDVSGSRHLPQTLNDAPCFIQENRNAIRAGKTEIENNPRARSAKLRWAIRTEHAARKEDFNLFGREVTLSLSSLKTGRV
ncbi:MAG: 16S rRNA (cytosine(1402)-N(4))-methyltransferase RsmH [Rhizobiaceae bacterium]|nr:16S rRNA (cytosine(1402)-N(4))-methyltransferase RsmH [Rhizobiaceae bacterium]